MAVTCSDGNIVYLPNSFLILWKLIRPNMPYWVLERGTLKDFSTKFSWEATAESRACLEATVLQCSYSLLCPPNAMSLEEL
jgi:hypothetical protein